MTQMRISLNKLGEYLQANPSRRKRIVKDAKEPQPYVVTRYREAKNIIKEFIIAGYDYDLLEKGIINIKNIKPETEFQEQDKRLSIDLLESMLDMELPDLSDFDISEYDGNNPKIVFSDVNISINPDLIIRGLNRGQKVVGAIKIHISASNQLNIESAKTVTTLLKKFVEDYVAEDDEKVSSNLCISIETFGKLVGTSPNSFKRRMSHIESACEEIALRWESV